MDINNGTGVYTTINKPRNQQLLPLPLPYEDNDHSMITSSHAIGQEPVYDVAVDKESAQKNKELVRRPSQYEVPICLQFSNALTETTLQQ